MGKISSGSLTVVDVKGGSDGINTATIYLYQRATTAPSKPSTNLIYTFATAKLTGGLGNWTQDIGTLTGSDPIWVIAAVASSNGTIDVIEPTEWSEPIKMAQDGQDGQPGEPGQPGAKGLNQATVFIYKRDDSVEKPNSVTYTFATGSFTVPTGWSTFIPQSNGKPCWVCSAVAIGSDATAQLSWTTPSVMVEDGSDGVSPVVTSTDNGVQIYDPVNDVTYTITNGVDGTSYYTHILYSSKATPTSASDVSTSPTGKDYVGIQTTTSRTAPSWNDSGWQWVKYVGEDGAPATQYYAFVKYATNSSGANMRDTPADGYDYVGTYTGTKSNPAASDFNWSKYTGEPGQPATQYYAFIKYATSSTGANMTDTPTASTKYVGTYSGTKASPVASDYKWSVYVGTDGVSVIKTRELYYLKTNSTNVPTITATSQITATDRINGWTSVVPTYVANGTYYTCIETSLSVGGPVWSTPVENQGLTDANANAAESLSVSTHANENAQGALSISRATQQHFWFVPENTGSGASLIEAGAYITDTAIDTFKSGKNGGYLLARSDGLELGRGTNKFMTLSATALNFYRPGTNTIDATLTSKGLILTKGGLKAGTYNVSATDANQNFVYLSSEDYGTGVKIGNSSSNKKDWRQIIGKKFGVDRAGNLYASGANITGHISAESLTIASNAAIDPRIDNESVQVGGSNLLISRDFVRNQKLTLVESTGELIQEARQGYIISGPMEVQPSLPVIIQFWVNLEDAAETADLEVWFSGLCFYDAEDTYITGYSPETVTTYYEMRKVIAPSNASYCCFSFSVNAENIYWSNVWNNGNNGHNIKVELGSTPTTFTLSQEDVLNRIPTQVSDLTNDENYASFNNFFDRVPHIDEEGVSDEQTVITFESDNDILPISEVKVDILYTQEGSGNPSSRNIRPINGINSVTVYLSATVEESKDDYIYTTNFVLPVEREQGIVNELTTVYGGVLNVTAGILEVNYLAIDSYNGEKLPRLGSKKELPPVWVSDRDVYDPNGTPSIGAQVVYQIPDSIEYQVEAQQIMMLIGTNNLWSSCGNISVSTITNVAEQDSTYRLIQDMVENFSRANKAIVSQNAEVTNLYNLNTDTQKDLTNLKTQVEKNTQGITKIQDSVEVKVRTPEGEGETYLTVKSVETLEDQSSIESSIKITPYQITLQSGENEMVSWLNATSFNTSRLVAADIRPWNIVMDNETGQVTTSGSVAIIGRRNGHVSIKRIENTET